MLSWRVFVLFLILTAGSLRAQYVVEAGDTLSGIAKKTLGDGNRWQEIATLNQIVAPYRLRVGQELRLPSSNPAASEVVPSVPVQPSAPTPVAAETTLGEETKPPGELDEAELISQMIGSMVGRDVTVPAWLIGWPLLVLFGAVVLLVHVPFWAIGVMFTMYLFKHELSRRTAFLTASSWVAITLFASLPLFFISVNEHNITQSLPWLGGLFGIYLLVCINVTRKITQCPWWQSPIIFFLGQLFGTATAITLMYIVLFFFAIAIPLIL